MIVITIGELSMGKKLKCPAATQDLELNTKNRDASIKAEHIQYGPLNVDEPGDYWKDIAEHWNTTEKAAKKSLCGNCVAFDISPRMKECMPGETSDDEGVLGYCWMHHFKCHSARTCRTWAKGGPIEDDDISADWQERNKMDEMKAKPLFKKTKHPPYSEYVLALDEKKRKRRKKKKTKKDRCYRIAKRKYDAFPSAYASGAIVKCRQGKIWKDLKEEDIPLEEKKKKAGTESSKESSLRDWFKRKGAPGKSGGWVDCNTCRKDKKTGRTKCKPCGRQEGEKRAKYPACRPTPGACKERGRSKTWGKKSAKGKK